MLPKTADGAGQLAVAHFYMLIGAVVALLLPWTWDVVLVGYFVARFLIGWVLFIVRTGQGR